MNEKERFIAKLYPAAIEVSKETGMKVCTNNGNTNCHVDYSACSLLVRI